MTGPAAGTPRPLVIAHRGASGNRPEHTLASYDLAIAQGADFIEPDLVSTRDGRLIARHEPELSTTTDVADRFPDRKSRTVIDGTAVEGWFAADFTLAELKTLRCRQRFGFRTNAWDGLFAIPTFEEVLALAFDRSRTLGRTIGIYPETKHPTWHAGRGLALEPPLLRCLSAHGLTERRSPVFIQSFEVANLQTLAGQTRVRLVQLLGDGNSQPYDFAAAGDPRRFRAMMTPEGLAEITRYACAIGPSKRSIVPVAPDGVLQPATRLIADAHAGGLAVHAYTFRDEPAFLAPNYACDPIAEYRQFFALGVDGVFSDFPDTAVRARRG